MPKVIVTTDQNDPIHTFELTAEDLATPIARANFFLDLNAALKIAARITVMEEQENVR